MDENEFKQIYENAISKFNQKTRSKCVKREMMDEKASVVVVATDNEVNNRKTVINRPKVSPKKILQKGSELSSAVLEEKHEQTPTKSFACKTTTLLLPTEIHNNEITMSTDIKINKSSQTPKLSPAKISVRKTNIDAGVKFGQKYDELQDIAKITSTQQTLCTALDLVVYVDIYS